MIQGNDGNWYQNPRIEGTSWLFQQDDSGYTLTILPRCSLKTALRQAKKIGLLLAVNDPQPDLASGFIDGTMHSGCHRYDVSPLQPIPTPQDHRAKMQVFPDFQADVLGWVWPVAMVPDSEIKNGAVKKGFWIRK